MAPVLGYWNIRGLAESIRYLLNFLGVEFVDKKYEFGPAPNYFDNTWTKEDKHNLGLELPNIPYYIDDDVKITQSTAIMRYLSRKHDELYFPEKGNDVIRFEIMEGHTKDISISISFMIYSPQFEKLRETFETKFKEQLQVASKFLDTNDWIMGSKISYIDFCLFETIDVLKMIYPNCLDGLENISKYLERFSGLPGVQKYRMDSVKLPPFPPFSNWTEKN